MKQRFLIEGMSCSACSASVERVVRKIKGVTQADVNLVAKTLLCVYDEKQVQQSDIINAVTKAGFTATLETTKVVNANKGSEGNLPSVSTRLIVSIIFLLPLMYIGMGRMLGLPVPRFLAPQVYPIAYALFQLILATPVLYVNRKFFYSGIRAFMHRSPNMDTLVSTGSLASYFFGLLAVFMISYAQTNGDYVMVEKYVTNLYFESSAMILTLITIGKALEENAKSKTGQAIEELKKLVPDSARIVRDGVAKLVKLDELVVGDIVAVGSGESIAVDGIVIKGNAYIDQSVITGESVPIFAEVNDKVMSATVNTDGYIEIRATAVGGDTTLSHIIDLVREAGATKAPIAKLADRISGVFVPIVMSLALITLIIWLIIGVSFEVALSYAISVLVISCPCALGLATPVAVTASIGACARKGILVKMAEAFEILAKTDFVIFDKTGTITEGKPIVNEVYPVDITEKELLQYACTLEQYSSHPLAKAVLTYCGDVALPTSDYLTVPGKGVVCVVLGQECVTGNRKFLEEKGVDITSCVTQADKLASQGNTVLWFARGKKTIGLIAVSDKIKDNVKTSINQLKAMGVTVAMLSGDSTAVCNAVKNQVGIDIAYAEVLPDGKEKVIISEQNKGHIVAFVGDGINDSPALARANIGLAVGGGTAIAIDTADVVLMKDDVSDVVDSIFTGRRTLKIIKENLFWAFFYNVICIPLAMGVFSSLGISLNPMIGALAMSVSSLFVVTNALRLRFIKKERKNDNNKN